MRGAFARFPEVSVAAGDLLAAAHDVVVSPANSFGFMDGGIDRRYVAFFGPQIEAAVRSVLARLPGGSIRIERCARCCVW